MVNKTNKSTKFKDEFLLYNVVCSYSVYFLTYYKKFSFFYLNEDLLHDYMSKHLQTIAIKMCEPFNQWLGQIVHFFTNSLIKVLFILLSKIKNIGDLHQLGHADFYPWGGYHQNGCFLGPDTFKGIFETSWFMISKTLN